ncbi:hypothetical protein Tco_0623343 [Tanacetum coccineum]
MLQINSKQTDQPAQTTVVIPGGEQTKIEKGKKAISSRDAEEESTESDSDDETTHVPGSTVESSKEKELKRFDFFTKDGEHVCWSHFNRSNSLSLYKD